MPSPDGQWLAYTDNDNDLWLLNMATKAQTLVSSNREGASDVAWAPDSRCLAWSQTAANSFDQILLYALETKTRTPVTSDRVNSRSAAFSPDGQWLYFLSDRNLASVVGAPWGPRQPEPFFGKPMKIYQVALRKGTALALRAGRRAAPGGAGGEETGAGREEGCREEG